jgi:chitinase
VSFCTESSVDIIPLAFINKFPAQANGWVEETFGNHACFAGNFQNNPGWDGVNNPANNFLALTCPELQQDIPICQKVYGKKIIISLGGAVSANSNYQLTGQSDGIKFAQFLWGAYGPYKGDNSPYMLAGGVRPLGLDIDIDGFDFDIENAPTGIYQAT